MSASPAHQGQEEVVVKDADLAHSADVTKHTPAPTGAIDNFSNGDTAKHQADPDDDEDDDPHEQPQDESKQAPQDPSDPPPHAEESAAAEDDNIMQGHPATQEQAQYEVEVKEQDRWLPIANVARIMKTALPDNAKIAKEAKECMQECVSEFISFITSEASEKCQHEKRKTVNGEDVIFAMTSLGFENYSEALRIYLVRYRESNLGKAEGQQGQGRSATPGQGQGNPSSADDQDDATSASIHASSVNPSVGPGAGPGVALPSTFTSGQEGEAANNGAAPYAYPAISNGGTAPY